MPALLQLLAFEAADLAESLRAPQPDPVEQMLADVLASGQDCLRRLATTAVGRLLTDPQPGPHLFNEAELRELADELAAAQATADVLGRSLVADHGERVRQANEVRESRDAAGHDHDQIGRFSNASGAAAVHQAMTDHVGHAHDDIGDDEPLTTEQEAALDQAAEKKVSGIFAALKALPSKVLPQRLQSAGKRIKDAVVGAMQRRYGERGAALIFKVAALSAPVPLPGSQPAAIVLSLVIAEGVRALGKLRGGKVAESREQPLTAADISEAAAELLGEIEARVKAELSIRESWNEADHPRGQPDNAGEFGPGGAGPVAGRHEAEAAADYKANGTKSKAFKAWFGDWENEPEKASKVRVGVRNADGEHSGWQPRIVYHGTNKEFDEFRPSRDGAAGPGIYFAISPDKAGSFAGGGDKPARVFPVYLSIKNPLRVPVDETHLAKEYAKKARQEGYDGLYIAGPGEWVAFEPHQIKSVHNAGTFDPKSAKIHESREPSPLHQLFEDAGKGLRPMKPQTALEFFRALVPTLGSTPVALLPNYQRVAFTLAVATDQELLERVQAAIAERIESGELSTGAKAVQDILDAAGVGSRNPQYADMVFRTNCMDAYNAGVHAQLEAEAETFPVWMYMNPDDSRSRKTHAQRNGRYYPTGVTIDQVRGTKIGEKANCRCTPRPVDRWTWDELYAAGERVYAVAA